MKQGRLEIRINSDTKKELQIIASHLTPTGSVSELLTLLINETLEKHKYLLDKPLVS